MFIKKGDKVVVITGKDKGKVGTVIEAQPKKDRVVVEGETGKATRVRFETKDGKKVRIAVKSGKEI